VEYDVTRGLDPEQRDAVMVDGQSIAVIAGAGSGKTRCLSRRMVRHLLEGIAGQYILGITFTRAASEEMRERIAGELGEVDARLTRNAFPEITTLHGWGARQIRRHPESVGRSRGFVVYDQRDKDDILSLIAQDMDLRERGKEPSPAAIWRNPKARTEYFHRLESADALDFDMLVPLAAQVVRRYPVEYKRVLVDESQDTNKRQWELIDAIAAPTFMVGDWRQAIFGFQGSDPGHFLERCSTADRVIKIPTNYRSRPGVVQVANNTIAKLDPVWADQRASREQGEVPAPIAYVCGNEPEAVAELVARALRRFPAREIAVLGRTWRELDAVHQDLMPRGIEVTFAGPSADPWDPHEARQLARMLLIGTSPNADQLVRLVANWGERRADTQRLLAKATRARLPLVELLAQEHVPWRVVVDGADPMNDSATWAELVISRFVFEAYASRGLRSRLAILEACVAWLKDRPMTLEAFKDYWLERGVQERMREQSRGVTLTTVHGAKGLEWGCVIAIGMRDGTYPDNRSKTPAHRDEDLRLVYVASTRAKDELYLTSPYEVFLPYQAAPMPCRPSPFVPLPFVPYTK
jgi:DNA helicase-2/ATP-dependent DNA helicase PcrA